MIYEKEKNLDVGGYIYGLLGRGDSLLSSIIEVIQHFQFKSTVADQFTSAIFICSYSLCTSIFRFEMKSTCVIIGQLLKSAQSHQNHEILTEMESVYGITSRNLFKVNYFFSSIPSKIGSYIPFKRTVMGILIWSFWAAPMIPRATSAQSTIPPKMLTRIALTCHFSI